MFKQIENPDNLLISDGEILNLVTILEPVQAEWTKYFVNGIECERENIYQTILDNEFYNGKVTLEKKYHFEKHEETIKYFSQNRTNTQRNDNANNESSSFSLDTRKFAEKYHHKSGEYNLLIVHMIYVLDSFFETNISYKDNANNLKIAVRQSMTYIIGKLNDHQAPFDMLINKLAAELYVFLFDNLAFISSKNENTSEKLPSLGLDMSNIKETWDSQWNNSKKSKYLKQYLSEMIKQTDLLLKNLIKHELFADKAALQNEIKDKFSDFKEIIKSFQQQKETIDKSLPEIAEQSIIFNITSFFHQNPSQGNVSNTSSTVSFSKK